MSLPMQRARIPGDQGADALGDAFQQVTRGLTRVQEVLRLQERQVTQCVHEASRRHEQRTAAALREALAHVEQRFQEKDEAVRILAQRVEARARKVEEWITVVEQRLIPLVGLKGAQALGGAVESGELELRMRKLEASVQRALVSVFPRVDALVAHLEKSNPGAGVAPFSASSSPYTCDDSNVTSSSFNLTSRSTSPVTCSTSPASFAISNIPSSSFTSSPIASNSSFTISSEFTSGANATRGVNATSSTNGTSDATSGANATSSPNAVSSAIDIHGSIDLPSANDTCGVNDTSGANGTSRTNAIFAANLTPGVNAPSGADETSGVNGTSISSSRRPSTLITSVLRTTDTRRPALSAQEKANVAHQNAIAEWEQAQKQRVELRVREVKIRRDNARAAPSSMGETLCNAVNIGKLNDIRRLLDSAADVNYIDTRGDTPLILALLCPAPREDVVNLLLERGAEVNAVDVSGQTALHFAAALDRNWQFVPLLIGAGGDVNARNACGATPLHWAAHRNNEAAVRALLKASASKNLKCWSEKWSGKTPFDVARSDDVRQLLRP